MWIITTNNTQQIATRHSNFQKGIAPIIAIFILAVILVCVGGAYYFKQQQAKLASKSSVVDTTANWKAYTNKEREFSIQYPPEWKVTERKGSGNSNSRGLTLEGKEGSVYLDWGSGFGGMCDPNKETLKLYNNTVLTCLHNLNNDGTESWSFSIGKETNGIGYISSAVANKPSSLNRDTILKILSTLKLIDPTANWKTYINNSYNFSLKYPSQLTPEETSFTNNAPVALLNNTFTVTFTNKNENKLNQNVIMLRIFNKNISISNILDNYYGTISNDWTYISIGNVEGMMTDALDNVTKNTVGKVAYAVNGNNVYYFHISNLTNDASISELTFNRLLSTFKFTN